MQQQASPRRNRALTMPTGEEAQKARTPLHQAAAAIWQWRTDHDTWERFLPEDVDKLENALASRSDGLVIDRNSSIYYIDLVRNTQTNTETGRERPLQRIVQGSTWTFCDSGDVTVFEKTAAIIGRPDGGDAWSAFSHEVQEKLDRALFGGEEYIILERAGETLYVDLQRWTLTNLNTSATCAIRVVPAKANQQAQTPWVRTSITVGAIQALSPSQLLQLQYSVQQPETKPASRKISGGSERTCSTASTSESGTSFTADDSDDGPRYVSGKRYSIHEPLWMWRNNEGLWSTFDDEIAGDIEAAFSKGETGIIMNRQSQDNSSSYFLDLEGMTQTNLATGFIRNIERRVNW